MCINKVLKGVSGRYFQTDYAIAFLDDADYDVVMEFVDALSKDSPTKLPGIAKMAKGPAVPRDWFKEVAGLPTVQMVQVRAIVVEHG